MKISPSTHRPEVAWILALLLSGAGCQRGPTPEEAERLVRAYTTKVIEAYRVSDEQLVDPLVGEQQGIRLLGLIGVKRDMGITLDSQLLELRVEQVAGSDSRVEVVTSERWRYRDLQIGTGRQVGADSTDSYRMRYRFERSKGRWLLEELSFESPPVVGRPAAPMQLDTRTLHGLPSREEEAAAERQAAEERRRAAPQPAGPAGGATREGSRP